MAGADPATARRRRAQSGLTRAPGGVGPRPRIVYADYDPLVLTHARALLGGTPE
ncbi:SAM-dependent methyltransferase, partial [Frankia sp. AgKG'84/4]|uniref:SAM-dependent methyltransferase n=1 Tax=Frankia sp. AgKG'84/4 TaxID=573490 RepID=UPI0035B151F6